jgi:hypothetical protein
MASKSRLGWVPQLTRHAHLRLQQRGIQRQALQVLLDYGTVIHDGHGAEICLFDRRSRERARKALPAEQFRKVCDRLNCYAVVGADDAVVTVGHRRRRRRRS